MINLIINVAGMILFLASVYFTSVNQVIVGIFCLFFAVVLSSFKQPDEEE
jgi:hypothetical protein